MPEEMIKHLREPGKSAWDVTISDLITAQYGQQAFFEGGVPEGRADQRALAERYAMYLIGEVYEYLDLISYKRHIPKHEVSRSSRVIEIVDILKYVLALAWVEQVGVDELVQAFESKTMAVYERHNKERLTELVAAFDIDGVLADISTSGYDRTWQLEDVDRWLEAGNISKMKPYPVMIEAMRQLKYMGWSIVLVTSRKRHRHANVELETYDWLTRHGVPYDLILWGYDKSETMAEAGIRPRFYVEDSAKHALDVADWGVPVYHIAGSDYPLHPLVMGITHADFRERVFDNSIHERYAGYARV